MLAWALTSCSGNGDLKEMVQNHFNALNRHDVKALVAGYDKKVEITSSAAEGISRGSESVQKAYEGYFQSSPDLKYDVAAVHYSNNGVVTVEYTASGTMKSITSGMPAYMLGKRYIINYCAIFTVQNGKIIKESTYFDQVSFLKQMGFFDQK
jgi:steroid delta-isomerase-like uncharacterized protein